MDVKVKGLTRKQSVLDPSLKSSPDSSPISQMKVRHNSRISYNFNKPLNTENIKE